MSEKIKVAGKLNNLGNNITIERNKNKLTVNSDIDFSKRWEKKLSTSFKLKCIKFVYHKVMHTLLIFFFFLKQYYNKIWYFQISQVPHKEVLEEKQTTWLASSCFQRQRNLWTTLLPDQQSRRRRWRRWRVN